MNPALVLRSGIVLKPSTLLHLHHVLAKRKYRMFFSSVRRRQPGPKGPDKELIGAVVELKQRNPTWVVRESPRRSPWLSALQSTRMLFAVSWALIIGRKSDSGGPSWFTFLGHMKDSLWSCDLFRCESARLRTHWVLVVMDHFTRRIVGFAVGGGIVDGAALCRMFNRAVRGHTTRSISPETPEARLLSRRDELESKFGGFRLEVFDV